MHKCNAERPIDCNCRNPDGSSMYDDYGNVINYKKQDIKMNIQLIKDDFYELGFNHCRANIIEVMKKYSGKWDADVLTELLNACAFHKELAAIHIASIKKD